MRKYFASVAAILAGIVSLAMPLSVRGQFIKFHIEKPNININPQKINPFNPDSDVNKELAELDKRRRQGGKDLSDDLKGLIHKGEKWTSAELFDAYRDHVVSKNRQIRGRSLKETDLHYKMIHPILGRELDLKSVTFYFDAYVPGDMAAITFEKSVYVHERERPDDPHQATLLAHEMTHSIQYARLGGWKGFASRYAGQIGESLRKGKLDNTVCIHDSLGLEKEATSTEKRVEENTIAGVTITNRTHEEIHYALRRHSKGAWKLFTLKPEDTYTHSTNLAESPNDFVLFAIHFDHDFAPGYQEKAYSLDDELIFEKRPFKEADGRHYHFEAQKHGIDLFTGKGTTPPPTPAKPVDTITASFKNGTAERVHFFLNGGKGLKTTLEPRKTAKYNVVVDEGVTPAVAITQKKGPPLPFSLKNGGLYEFKEEGGQIKNFTWVPTGKTKPAPHDKVVFSGKWIGEWKNSLGEKGKDALDLTEHMDGTVSGTYTWTGAAKEAGEFKVAGKVVNHSALEMHGMSKNRSYQITGTMQGGDLHLKYRATRPKTEGTYDGESVMKRKSVTK